MDRGIDFRLLKIGCGNAAYNVNCEIVICRWRVLTAYREELSLESLKVIHACRFKSGHQGSIHQWDRIPVEGGVNPRQVFIICGRCNFNQFVRWIEGLPFLSLRERVARGPSFALSPVVYVKIPVLQFQGGNAV